MSDKRKKTPPPFRSVVHRLPEKHNWKVSPGHQICVVDRGDLRFEFPEGWVMDFGKGSVKLHDKPYPHDSMVLEVSVIKTPGAVDMSRMPELNEMLRKSLTERGQPITDEEIHSFESPGLEGAWVEYDRMEDEILTGGKRLVTWRHCECHPGKYHRGPYLPVGILTYGFWSDWRETADPVWQHVLETLVMGQKIADPRVGPQYN